MSIYSPITFLTLLMMISFAVVNAVLITPALPAIAQAFNISANAAQELMVGYLLGYALGQLLYGPLANRYGRKPTLQAGIILQIASSLICIFAGVFHQFLVLVAARVALALGAGVGLKMAFTLVNEYYPAKEVSQKISYLMIAFAIAPGLAMAAGGFLNERYGWLSCFYAGAGYGLLLFLCTIQLPETKSTLDKDALKIKHLLSIYSDQFKNTRLLCGGLLMGLMTGFVYVFTALAPFIAINLLGMDSQDYGAANILPSIGYVIFAIATARLSKVYRLQSLIYVGIGITVVGVLIMLLTLFLHWPALISLFIPITIIYFGEVLVYPNTSALAMATVTDTAHASAVMSFLTIALPLIAVLSLSLFLVHIYLLPTVFAILSAMMIGLAWFIAHQARRYERSTRNNSPPSHP